MTDSSDLITEVLQKEGGYVNHPNDRGGPTNFGITQKTLSSWLKRPATIEEVKNLSEAQAREIYTVNYLTGPRIDTLPSPNPQSLVLDMAVNHGPGTAIMILQKTLNIAGYGPVSVDGVIGPATREATTKAWNEMGPFFQNAIVEERINFYRAIVAKDASQSVFLQGWLNRANSFMLPTE